MCLGGKGRLTGTKKKRIHGGSVIIVLPGEAHGFVSDDEDPLEYICVGVHVQTDTSSDPHP